MAHGAVSTATDSFTGNNTGATIAMPTNTDPDFPVRAHVVSVCTITGSVTGAAISYDVQMKDGFFTDSGQPPLSIAGSTGTVFRYSAIFSTGTIKGLRTRVSGWTGGTSCNVVTTVVYLI